MIRLLELVTSMEQAWEEVDDYTKLIDKTERLTGGNVKHERGLMKFRKPDQHYLRVDEGVNAGGEVIYPVPGGDRAIAHPGGFRGSLFRFLSKTPLVKKLVPTVFDITDPRIIKAQHHTISGSNLGSVIKLIAANIRTAAKFEEGTVEINETAMAGGAAAYRIEVRLPGKAGTEHVVAEGEDLWSIARKYNQNMYVILYNNATALDSVHPRPGQVLFIPRYYAPEGTIWVSKLNLMPVRLEVFDHDGNLYEAYAYTDIRINPGLTDQDFDPENSAYRF